MEHYDDFLEHYGVKGMKWGKHKRRSQYTSNTNETISRTGSGMSPEYDAEREYNSQSNRLVIGGRVPGSNSNKGGAKPLKNDPRVSREYREGFEYNSGITRYRNRMRLTMKQRSNAKKLVDNFLSGGIVDTSTGKKYRKGAHNRRT